MKFDKSLQSWVKEGLISEDQAKKITEFEEKAPRKSWFLYGIAAIGITAIITGIISIVASNWAEIPTNVKLGSYFIIQVALGLGFLKTDKTAGLKREVLLTLFALFFLAGIGLVGQIYNLESDGYSAIFFWCTLALLATLSAQSRWLPDIWHFAFLSALSLWISAKTGRNQSYSAALNGLSATYLLYGLALFRYNAVSLSRYFIQATKRWSTLVLTVVTICASVIWSQGRPGYIQSTEGYIPLICAVIFVLLILLFSKPKYGSRYTVSLIAALSILAFYFAAPSFFETHQMDISSCALFIVVWGFVAAAAVFADRKRLFDFATLVICVRFIFCYFEVFGSLAATGVGLVISGAVILGIALIWHKYRENLLRAIGGAS